MIYLLIVSTKTEEGNTKWILPMFNFPIVRPNNFLSIEKTGPPLNPARTLQVVVNILYNILCIWPKTVDGTYSRQGYPTENIFWPVKQQLNLTWDLLFNIIMVLPIVGVLSDIWQGIMSVVCLVCSVIITAISYGTALRLTYITLPLIACPP